MCQSKVLHSKPKVILWGVRPNNLDLARLLLALTVFFGHVYFLSHAPELRLLGYFDGPFAVSGFFSISGFLIFASYERSRSLREYFTKRAMRILPGYWTSTLLCIAIAVAFSHSIHVGRFVLANLTFLNFLAPGVAGVFSHNPEDSILNGSLWTIKIEVAFYLIVPIVVWICRRFRRDVVLISITAMSIAYQFALAPNHPTLSYQLPGQMGFFCAGALIYYHLPRFRKVGRWMVLPAIAVYIGYKYSGWFILSVVCIPIIILGFGLLTPETKKVTGWGDFSYGIYVLHYPIVQTIVALGLFQQFPFSAFALSVVVVFASAILSWFFIERPCLALAHRPANGIVPVK